MYGLEHLTKVFESAEQIPFDNRSKIVLMSDCHRGDGSWGDTFSKNQNIYFTALSHYYNNDYIYIELGDGDELWENRKLSNIMDVHSDAFWLLSKFYDEDRLYFIFGNHDMVKKDDKYVINNFYNYFDVREKEYIPLFENIKVHEGLVLKHKDTKDKIFLIHGHQVDFLDDKMWKLRRWMVKYLWRPLEILGVNDPTSTAKNYIRKNSVEKKLIEWVIRENQMLIAGHTHKPVFPEVGEPPYFNDGSCVHPRCITGIEIEDGYITLVKWSVRSRKNGILSISRELLVRPRKLDDYFQRLNPRRKSQKLGKLQS